MNRESGNEKNDREMVQCLVEQLRKARPYGRGVIVDMSEADINRVVVLAKLRFQQEPTLLTLDPPMNVCGDIHGQFDDLLRIFKFCKSPSENSPYLFIGDYVDRGPQSLEVIVLLLSYKLLFPNQFYLTRGNHETASVNRAYGFYDECKRRYSVKLWREFQDCFNWMPIAAVVNGKIFCVHGGLSPKLTDLSQILEIQRPTEIPEKGLLCDLLWADPSRTSNGFEPNKRGISVAFGEDVVDFFCQTTGIELIVRAHQVVENGYEFFAHNQLLTIFTAPNYCSFFDNDSGVLHIGEDLKCEIQVLSLKTQPPEKSVLLETPES